MLHGSKPDCTGLHEAISDIQNARGYRAQGLIFQQGCNPKDHPLQDYAASLLAENAGFAMEAVLSGETCVTATFSSLAWAGISRTLQAQPGMPPSD